MTLCWVWAATCTQPGQSVSQRISSNLVSNYLSYPSPHQAPAHHDHLLHPGGQAARYQAGEHPGGGWRKCLQCNAGHQYRLHWLACGVGDGLATARLHVASIQYSLTFTRQSYSIISLLSTGRAVLLYDTFIFYQTFLSCQSTSYTIKF